MHLLPPDASHRTAEYRRYFPDWTPQRLRIGEELEADHNSYLAGGYAEEVGYLANVDVSRGVPVIDGESPDECSVRLMLGAATHPGYPLRPYPVSPDREPETCAVALSPALEWGAVDAARRLQLASAWNDHGTFVPVTERPYEHEHRLPARRAAAAFTRVLSSLATFRWGLRPFHD
jgi:hypothetical protein